MGNLFGFFKSNPKIVTNIYREQIYEEKRKILKNAISTGEYNRLYQGNNSTNSPIHTHNNSNKSNKENECNEKSCWSFLKFWGGTRKNRKNRKYRTRKH